MLTHEGGRNIVNLFGQGQNALLQETVVVIEVNLRLSRVVDLLRHALRTPNIFVDLTVSLLVLLHVLLRQLVFLLILLVILTILILAVLEILLILVFLVVILVILFFRVFELTIGVDPSSSLLSQI